MRGPLAAPQNDRQRGGAGPTGPRAADLRRTVRPAGHGASRYSVAWSAAACKSIIIAFRTTRRPHALRAVLAHRSFQKIAANEKPSGTETVKYSCRCSFLEVAIATRHGDSSTQPPPNLQSLTRLQTVRPITDCTCSSRTPFVHQRRFTTRTSVICWRRPLPRRSKCARTLSAGRTWRACSSRLWSTVRTGPGCLGLRRAAHQGRPGIQQGRDAHGATRAGAGGA
jgi:hypothetical protein